MKLTPRLIDTAYISSNFSNSRNFNFAIKKHPISPALTSVFVLCKLSDRRLFKNEKHYDCWNLQSRGIFGQHRDFWWCSTVKINGDAENTSHHITVEKCRKFVCFFLFFFHFSHGINSSSCFLLMLLFMGLYGFWTNLIFWRISWTLPWYIFCIGEWNKPGIQTRHCLWWQINC